MSKELLKDPKFVAKGLPNNIMELPAVASLRLLGHDRSVRALLVDDDPIFCQVMVRYAAKLGVVLKTCHDFPSLVSTLETFTPEVLMIDLHLDDVSGLDVASCLIEFPIVLVSSNLAVMSQCPVPASVAAAVHKKFGSATILNTAIQSSLAWKKTA